MGEVEEMVKTPQIPWDVRQSEMRDELTDATDLEIPETCMRQSRWMSVVGKQTTEILEEIEESWIEVKRRTKTQVPRQPEEDGKNPRMIQIFVKVDGSKTLPLIVSPSDKVDEVMRRTQNNVKYSKSDVHMTCEGRVIRRGDELRSSGVSDGSTVQITNVMRGGGNHRNKKNRAGKKPTAREHSEEKVVLKSEPVQG